MRHDPQAGLAERAYGISAAMNTQTIRPQVSVIVGVYQEAEAISPFLEELSAALDGLEYEILVVDDDSPDGTSDRVLLSAADNPRIRLIRRVGERGLASACMRGYKEARADILATCDGDGQHDPSHLRRLIEQIRSDAADLAVGSRFLDEEMGTGLGRRRSALSRTANTLTRAMFGIELTDPMSGMFAMSRAFYQSAAPRLSGVGFKILADLAASAQRRPRLFELPTRLRTRLGGGSKLDFRTMLELPALLVEKRSGGVVPARFFLFACVGASGVFVQLAAFTLLDLVGAGFTLAQVGAILFAMTSNFLLNNMLTFRDRRLFGLDFVWGLLVFYGVCSLGALVNLAAAQGLYAVGAWKLGASFFGALAGGVANYVLAARFAWAKRAQGARQAD